MDIVDEPMNIAGQLLDLSRIPDLKIESSPAAMKRLRSTHNRLVQASRFSEADLIPRLGPDEPRFTRLG